MVAAFTKLPDGSWGILVSGEMTMEGARVTVTKKDGTTTDVTLGKCLGEKFGGVVYKIAIQFGGSRGKTGWTPKAKSAHVTIAEIGRHNRNHPRPAKRRRY